MRWFSFSPNEGFTPVFQAFISAIIERLPGEKTAGKSFMDILPELLKLDTSDFIDFLESNEAEHMGIMAACYLEVENLPPSKRYDKSRQLCLIADVFDIAYNDNHMGDDWVHLMFPSGFLTVWERMPATDPAIKNELYKSFYKNSYRHIESNYQKGDVGIISSFVLGRTARLLSSFPERKEAYLDKDEGPIPDELLPFCTMNFLLSKDLRKIDDIVHLSHLIRSDNESPFKGYGEITNELTKWAREIIRLGIVHGHDAKAVIDGGALIFEGVASLAGADYEQKKLIVRQGLLDALYPYPEIIKSLNPSREDFFGRSNLLISEFSLEAQFAPTSLNASKEITVFCRSLNALNIDYEIEDIYNISSMAIIGLLKGHSGVHKSIERFFIEKILPHEHASIYLYRHFKIDSLDDETLMAMHMFRVSESHFSTLSIDQLPYREGQQEIVAKALYDHGALTNENVERFELDGAIVLKIAPSLAMGSKRSLIERDLGI